MSDDNEDLPTRNPGTHMNPPPDPNKPTTLVVLPGGNTAGLRVVNPSKDHLRLVTDE